MQRQRPHAGERLNLTDAEQEQVKRQLRGLRAIRDRRLGTRSTEADIDRDYEQFLAPRKRRRQRKAANRERLKESLIAKLPVRKGKQYVVWDSGTNAARGLCVLINPVAAKTYRCVYYFPGSSKPHYKTLGRFGEMSLEQARDLTRKARGEAKAGNDPRANDVTKADAFKVAFENFMQDKKALRSAQEMKQLVLNNTREWHARSVATIRDLEIRNLLRFIRDGNETKPPRVYLAFRLQSHLRTFFAWCVEEHIIERSPMASMSQLVDKKQLKTRKRDWFKGEAGDDAIKSLWSAADKIGGDGGRYLKAMLLLGKRKSALADMQWSDIQPDTKNGLFWDAPESGTNKRLHGVPLPKLLQRVLGARQSDGKVFGAMDLDKLQQKVRDESDVKDFFWHGVRHLCETKCAELRDAQERPVILPQIRDLLFDHSTKRGAGAGYDHHQYRPEMRAALEAWAGHVEALVMPKGASARLR